MQIRMGDCFRDGSTVLQVYGLKITSEGERRILVVSSAGERDDVAPWSLMEDCALEPAEGQTEVLFDSEIHR